MSDDIVALLRAWSRQAAKRGVAEVSDDLLAAADEIERLRAERDKARREVCTFVALRRDRKQYTVGNGLGSAAMAAFRKPVDPESVARERGWECFKEGR